MTDRYIPMHTLRVVCQMAVLPQAKQQIPVALAGPQPSQGGCIVMLERSHA